MDDPYLPGMFDDVKLRRHTDPGTSHQAAVEVAPKLTGLRAEFVRRLTEIGCAATANEVAAGDESIRKRAKECVAAGFIAVVGVRTCRITGKSAQVYWVRDSDV